MKTIGLVVLCFHVISGFINKHYGDVAINVKVNSKAEWDTVEYILHKHLKPKDIDIWKYPNSEGHAHILLPGYGSDVIMGDLDMYRYDYDVTVTDVGKLLDTLELDIEASKKEVQGIVGTYPRYDEVLSWFDNLTLTYPELVSTEDIGQTYEGRPHRILKLSTSGSNKWKVYVEGGTHAREWIAPATVIYITDQLIQGYANGSAEIMQWLDMMDWYILPVANPDGYEYCHTDERLWRKNRAPNDNTSCIGTDLNRNYAYQWGGVGADPDPCSNLYRGTNPESAIEVQNIVNFILPQAESFIWYMAYHSWGQQFFTRWDYTAEVVPPDNDELLDLAQRAADAITAVNGLFYEAGRAPVIMYAFSGSSADWARGSANIKYPYLEELRDNGTYSFVLPPEQILPTGRENWAGFQVVAREIAEKCDGVAPPGPCNP